MSLPPLTVNALTTNLRRSSMARRVLSGAFLGLSWGAALRAWMVTLVLQFGDRPQFTWQGTFLGILLPAALTGAVLGGAAYVAESSGGNRWRWSILSPVLLVLGPAIATDNFISILITTGMGGGAIGVALVSILGGYAFSGFSPKWMRWIGGLLSLLFTLGMMYGFYVADLAPGVAPSVSRVFGALLFVLLMVLSVAGIRAPSQYSAGPAAPSDR